MGLPCRDIVTIAAVSVHLLIVLTENECLHAQPIRLFYTFLQLKKCLTSSTRRLPPRAVRHYIVVHNALHITLGTRWMSYLNIHKSGEKCLRGTRTFSDVVWVSGRAVAATEAGRRQTVHTRAGEMFYREQDCLFMWRVRKFAEWYLHCVGNTIHGSFMNVHCAVLWIELLQ